MLAAEYFGFAMRLVTVVVPVAIYFLLLGLLNSRRHPQLLSGRQDFVLLMVALSPIFILPLLSLGLSLWMVIPAIVAVGVVIRLMSPSGYAWVIYNLSAEQARQAVARSLRLCNADFDEKAGGFVIGNSFLRISHFPLLRNVTLRLESAPAGLAGEFEHAMGRTLAQSTAETSPMAVAMMLVAMLMLVTPLSMFVQQVPTIVRLITDLIR